MIENLEKRTFFSATLYWDPGHTPTANGGHGSGGSGTWDLSSASWSNGSSDIAWNNATADYAVFGAGGGTVSLGAAISAGSLQFDDTAYFITGTTANTLALDPAGGFGVSVAASDSAAIEAPIVGTAGLNKTGAGSLILSAQDTYSGATNVSNGILSVTGFITQSQITYSGGGIVELSGNGTISQTPANWTDSDIGSPSIAGDATFDGTTWTVSGAGTDIGGTSDQFNGATQFVNGDATGIATVSTQSATSSGAKAGLMFRDSEDADSDYAYVAVTPGDGVIFQTRAITGANSSSAAAVTGISAPITLKITRVGQDFSGYYSSDGVTWTQVGSTATLEMSNSASVGLAVTSQNSGTMGSATFTGVSIAGDLQTFGEVKALNPLGNIPCCDCDVSQNPVRYYDGTEAQSETDLSSDAFGLSWGQTRSWSSRSEFSPTNVNGTGWIDSNIPYLLSAGNGNTNPTVTAVNSDQNYQYFLSSGSSYVSPYDDKNTLTHDTTNHEYVLLDSSGNKTIYSDFTLNYAPAMRGHFLSLVDANGAAITTTYTSNRLTQAIESDGTSDSVEYDYGYLTGSDPNPGLLSSVVEKIDRGGTLSTVRQAVYTYYQGTYSGGDAFGNQGDLKTAAVENAAGTPISTEYYRYYTAAQSAQAFPVKSNSDVASDLTGSTPASGPANYEHGMEMRFNPREFARLANNSGGTSAVYSLSNTSVKPYAQDYYEYVSFNGIQHIALETVADAGSDSAGGVGTYTYAYSINTNSDLDPSDYNQWVYKTVETTPSTGTNTDYANNAGNTILKVKQAGSDTIFFAHVFDGSDRITESDQSSAVISYDDTHNDLNITKSAGSGLITVTDYDSNNYVLDVKIQNGSGGTAVTQESFTYTTHTDLSGAITYPIASETTYPNTSSSGSRTTNFTYHWFNSDTSSQIKNVEEDLPSIDTTQNGDGSTHPIYVENNIYGQPVWEKDALGFLTYNEYDPTTGGLTETIKDVNTSTTSDYLTSTLPTGWSTPSGGGNNLVTTYQVDLLGRPTKMTSPNLNVTYYVYDDVNHSVRTYAGWNSTTHLTTGPTQEYREDWADGYDETLTTSDTPNLTTGNVPDGSESFTAGNIQSMSRNYFNLGGQDVKDDAYFNLSGATYSSTSGSVGTLSTNYYETTYAFNVMGRLAQTNSSNGTITKNIFDSMGNMTQTWVGTSVSNITEVAQYTYDVDSDLTNETLYGGGGDDRTNAFTYDSRDQLILETDGVGSSQPIVTATSYDNLGEKVKVQQYAGALFTSTNGVPDSGDTSYLRAQFETFYDNQGRVYQTSNYSVLPASSTAPGTVGPALVTKTYYDNRGNMMATESSAGLWTKMAYDSAGRLKVESQSDGATGSTWGNASVVNSDHVFSQVTYTYDGDSNIVFTTTADRFGTDPVNTSATSIGALGNPISTTAPPARLSYSASYFDAADRDVADINAGTFNGATYNDPFPNIATGGSGTSLTVSSYSGTVSAGDILAVLSGPGAGERATITSYSSGTFSFSSLTAPGTAPGAGSVFIMVDSKSLLTQTSYNAAGWVQDSVDPANLVTQTSYDALGRTIKTIADYTDGVATDHSNQTTAYTYDGDNNVTSMTAVMPSGEYSQTTLYTYGITIAQGSAFDDNDLLYEVEYPSTSNGTASSGQAEFYKYDGLGEQTYYQDRNGTTHTYGYDKLGRLSNDSAGVVSGVDSTVTQLVYVYNDSGLLQTASSYNSGSGVVNQISETYDGFGQLASDAQANSGSVVSGTTPTVSYTYDSSNGDRQTGITYPDGRVIGYNYSSGLDSAASRISNTFSTISGTTTSLQAYSYLGFDTPVTFADANGVTLSYLNGTGDGGDQYNGLDRFGRIVNQGWANASTAVGVDKYAYGYDQDSNVLYKNNITNTSSGTTNTALAGESQTYTYDGLNRLVNLSNGTITLSGTTATISSPTSTQGWALDALGNWYNSSAGSTVTARTNNAQNQVQTVGSATLAYDANGNTKTDQAGQTYIYDGWNRLVQVTNANGTVLAKYTYDAEGRRLTESQGTVATSLYYSNRWQVVQENVGSLVTAEHVWSPFYVDAMIQTVTNPQVTTTQSNGSVDTGFGTNTSNHVTTTTLTSTPTAAFSALDGTDIVVAILASSTPELLFYNASGGMDSTFGSSGIVTLSTISATSLTGMVVQSNGKIDLGLQNASGGMIVAQLTSSGSLDTGFNTTGVQTFSTLPAAKALVLGQNGDLLLAGISGTSFVTVELNPVNGSLDTAYNSSGSSSITPSGAASASIIGVAESSNGDLVIAGMYSYPSGFGGDGEPIAGAIFYALFAIGASGSADTLFGSSGIDTFSGPASAPGYSALTVNPSGQIYLGLANFVVGGSGGVVLKAYDFNSNGTLDTAFGTSGVASTGTISGNGSGLILQIQLNGQIVVGAGGNHFIVARFNSNGTLDTTFGTSGIKIGVAVAGGLSMVTAASGEAVLIGKLSGINGIILQEFSTLAATRTLYVEYDADYNVTSLTDGSGNVAERYEYDGYGNVTVEKADGTTLGNGSAAGSFYGWVYLHQGLRLSVAAGLYDDRSREYDPALGKLLQDDSARYIDGPNLEQIELCNPIKAVDPSGEDSWAGAFPGTGGLPIFVGNPNPIVPNGPTPPVTPPPQQPTPPTPTPPPPQPPTCTIDNASQGLDWWRNGNGMSASMGPTVLNNLSGEAAKEGITGSSILEGVAGALNNYNSSTGVGSSSSSSDGFTQMQSGASYVGPVGSGYFNLMGHHVDYACATNITVSNVGSTGTSLQVTGTLQISFKKIYTFVGKELDGIFAGPGKTYVMYGTVTIPISTVVSLPKH